MLGGGDYPGSRTLSGKVQYASLSRVCPCAHIYIYICTCTYMSNMPPLHPYLNVGPYDCSPYALNPEP